MLIQSSSAIRFVGLICLVFLPLAVESVSFDLLFSLQLTKESNEKTLISLQVTVKGRLRNFAYNTKCIHATGQDNGSELEIVDCSDSGADQIIEANGFQVKNTLFSYNTFMFRIPLTSLLALHNTQIIINAESLFYVPNRTWQTKLATYNSMWVQNV